VNKTTVAQQAQITSTLAPAQGLLQRQCVCGNFTLAGGECAECAKKTTGLQRKLTIGASNAPLEQEADRVAEQVVSNSTTSSVTSLTGGRIQRQEIPKEKTNEEKYKEGLEKLGEAFLKTPLGKELLEKIKQDALVKGATAFGKDFISTWPGKIITGAAATGAIATLAATHKELPAQIPEIPLDILTPGLSVKLTYKGPVDKPTEAMITFKYSEQPSKTSANKKPMSESDKFRAETARLAAEQARFRAGMKFTPGLPEDLQQKAEDDAIKNAALKYRGGPDIEATIKKYPWLVAPQSKSGLQLTMPKLSFGNKSPSLFGDEFKLKLPEENKKKQDEPVLQKKLRIGASNDPLEREADQVAEQVMATTATSPIKPTPLRIQRYAGQATEEPQTAPASVDRVLAGSGRPMESALRQDMEQRFGHDFSQVRVHSGGGAEQSARDVDAKAYTSGHNIVFGEGGFSPATQEGRRLIAHELTHVVQQERGSTQISRKIRCDPQASLNGFLSSKGVLHYTENNKVYERPKGGAVNFEQEILIDMLAAPRMFNVDGNADMTAASNLGAHIKARIGIVSFAGKKTYRFAAMSGWSMNPKYYDWNVSKASWKMKPNVDRQEAWDDLNVNPQQYAIGCAAATDLTMKGGSKGAAIINKPSSDIGDWVAGDAGYIENTKFPAGAGSGVLGENLIYTGNGQFWGHLPGTQTYRTLPEWIQEVQSWHGGAKVDDKREMPATGLIDT